MTDTYEPLERHLRSNGAREVTLSFSDIEELIGRALPRSARKHAAFWANEDAETTRHYHCKAWRNADYFAEADRKAELVRFFKV